MSVRHGLYDWLTLEGHAEEVTGLYNGGAGLLARTGDFGVLSAAASGSSYRGQGGLQTYVAFETKFWGLSFNASSTRTLQELQRYRRRDGAVDQCAGRLQRSGFVEIRSRQGDRPGLGRISPAGFLEPGLEFRSPGAVLGGGLQSGERRLVARRFTPNRSFSSRRSRMCRTARTTASLAASRFRSATAARCPPARRRAAAAPAYTTDASRPLASQPGSYGWRVRDSEGAVPLPFGRGLLSRVGGDDPGRRRAVARQRGPRHRPGRWCDRHHGPRCILHQSHRRRVCRRRYRHSRNSGVITRTGRSAKPTAAGQLLVPNLRAYGSNKISIDPKGLPVNAEIESTEDVVAPADRSGVLVKFATKTNVPAAVVILVGANGKPLRGRLQRPDRRRRRRFRCGLRRPCLRQGPEGC